MRRLYFKNWHLWVLVMILIIIAVIGISLLEAIPFQPLSVINRILAPFQIAVSFVWDIGNDIITFFRDYGDFQREREDLYKRIAQLEREVQYLDVLYQENLRLQKLLDFPEREDFWLQGARIIGFYPDNWNEGVIIDRGHNHGLEEDMIVITYHGYLFGMVEKVFPSTAHVLMITNPSFVVGSLVHRKESRALGVFRGGVQENDLYLMDSMSWDADIKVGDTVVTSGMSPLFPKGLRIGEVVEVQPGAHSLTQKALINPFMNRQTVEEVLVIIGEQEK